MEHAFALQPKTASGGRAEKATEIFLSALFLVLPLFLHDTFHDATETKLIVFYALSGAYLLALLYLFLRARVRREPLGGEKLEWPDLFFAAFLACGVVSSLLGGFAGVALFAPDNRYQGIVTLLLYAVLFVCIRRFGRFTRMVRAALFFSFAVVCVLGVLNQMRIDPFGYIGALIPPDRARFTSTVGNIGFYGAYCVLLFPIAYMRLLREKTPRRAALTAVLSAVGLL